MKKWIRKFASFKSANKADQEYYLKMSPAERLDIMQFLRDSYHKLKGESQSESSGRLRRVIKIIRQA